MAAPTTNLSPNSVNIGTNTNTTHDARNDNSIANGSSIADTVSDKSNEGIPAAPPGATKLQMQLWSRVLARRSRQLSSLKSVYFHSFANSIVKDLETSRSRRNQYCLGAKDADKDTHRDTHKKTNGDTHKKTNGAADKDTDKDTENDAENDTDKDVQKDNGDEKTSNKIDLATGYYDTHLLTQHPLPQDVGTSAVTLHFVALFYRSIDDRLHPAQRKHAVDALRRAFSSLDEWILMEEKRPETASETPAAAKDTAAKDAAAMDVENQENGMPHRKGKTFLPPRPEAEEPANKRARKDPPEKALGSPPEKAPTKPPEKYVEPSATPQRISNSADDDNDSDVVVLDLTDDPPANKTPYATAQTTFSEASKEPRNDDQKEPSNTETFMEPAKEHVPKLPSPPPSPPPQTLILKHTPPSLPSPQPVSEVKNVAFLADNPIASASLKPRTSCILSYDAGFHLDGSGACLQDDACNEIRERLETWDPYWKIIEEMGRREVPSEAGAQQELTWVGTRTTPCVPAAMHSTITDYPVSCVEVYIDLPSEVMKSYIAKGGSSPWGAKWGERCHANRRFDSYDTGDRRLIVRTLPLIRTSKEKKKRADTHLWPIGTFVQLLRGHPGQGLEFVIPILQRKQQSHDARLWKGMSYALDLTERIPNTNSPVTLKMCCREEIVSDNSHVEKLVGSYAVHVAICEYVGADALYDQLMGKVKDAQVIIPELSLRAGRAMARKYLMDQTVSIDESDEEETTNNSDPVGSNNGGDCLTFSLLCSMSKTAMETPVRGRNCKHMQCFDLRNFLRSNQTVSGGRWRCGVCEDFLSVRDLVRCGLFQAMLDEYRGEVSGCRDRVSLKTDGTWTLMDENKLRYANKRDNANGNKMESTSSENDMNGSQKRAAEPEVIDLL